MSHRENETPSSYEELVGGSSRNTSQQKDGENLKSATLRTKSPAKCKKQRPKSDGLLTKSHSNRQRALRKTSPTTNLHNTTTGTPQTKRSAEIKRNREAARALKEGTLTSTKKYIQEEFPVEVVKPESPSRREIPPEESDSTSSDSDFDIPKSHQEEEVFAVRQKLLKGGVDVPFKTLKRGLMSPSERGYDKCMSQLPKTSSLSLLNEPEAWLGNVFRKYQLAEKALQRANERMVVQTEMEAKALAKTEEMETGKTKRKTRKKRRPGTKRKQRLKVKSTAVT